MATRSKQKTAYFCTQCGTEHPKWQGQCRECSAWNSLAEERVPARRKSAGPKATARPVAIGDIQPDARTGIQSGIPELDRVLGGHLLPGMTILLAGEPGIGKSTLLLQAAHAYTAAGVPILYVTGEESLPQIRIRAERLGVAGNSLAVLNSTDLTDIVTAAASSNYGAVLVDSIQTVSSDQLDSPPGTVGQIRESAAQLIYVAKQNAIALFLVGHVTKEGAIAGPKVLEHMVDTVVYFEGDPSHVYRMLRVTKNRFGAVSEIGLFQMTGRGLVEVANPSSFFLPGDDQGVRPGAAVTAVCEGNRPLLVEIQALVSSTSYGTAQRVAGGIDNKRLALLLAILEKRCDYPLSTHDVFVSVAAGLRLNEPAVDLAIMAAIVSSLTNRPVTSGTLVIGEVGLSGELRGVTMIERRIAEAAKLGFQRAVLPRANADQFDSGNIKVDAPADIQSALESLLD